MTPEERHERHHVAMAAQQERIDRIEQHAYDRAKKMHVHAPRKFAKMNSRSHRVSQVASWRMHLIGLHGVKHIGPFVGLAELQKMHDELHQKES